MMNTKMIKHKFKQMYISINPPQMGKAADMVNISSKKIYCLKGDIQVGEIYFITNEIISTHQQNFLIPQRKTRQKYD